MERLTELKDAAEHGSVDAMYELGMMYYAGDSVAEDEREAMKWLKRAAAKGDQIADEMVKQWNEYRRDEHLIKLLGKEYIEKYGIAVVLHYPRVGKACTTPLSVPSNSGFSWVRIAAYGCVAYDDEVRLHLGKYKVGKKLTICMLYPFYCKIGDTFSVSFFDFPSSRFITCQLLGIIKLFEDYAEVRVKVISDGTCLSFVKKVSVEQKAMLKQTAKYRYTPSWVIGGFYPKNGYHIFYPKNGYHINDRFFKCIWQDWDYETYQDIIYTDDDGIDHLVESKYSDRDSCEAESLFGDKILGFHKYCPIEIEREMNF